MTGPTVLELFAGIGGLSLGLERAGFHVVGQVEINPFARSILAKHWPEVPKHDDVKTALDWWLSEPRPRVDCVAGGYPCQPESLAGARRGTDDERWLWPEFAAIVHALRPRWVIGENVMGHRTKGLRFVLRDLERLGYTASAGVVSAEEMGAPHQRKRIFVIAEWEELANASGIGRGPGPGLVGGVGTAERSAAVANPEGGRRESGSGHRWPSRGWRGESRWRDWWSTEPGMGRVAHGVPARVDRLKGLGNAVVPACGEFAGHLVLSGAWRDAA